VTERLVHVLHNAVVLRVKDGILLAVEIVDKLSHNEASTT